MTRMHSADYAVERCMSSVCPSVCLSHAGNLSKLLNISPNFIHHRAATPFYLGNDTIRAIVTMESE